MEDEEDEEEEEEGEEEDVSAEDEVSGWVGWGHRLPESPCCLCISPTKCFSDQPLAAWEPWLRN